MLGALWGSSGGAMCTSVGRPDANGLVVSAREPTEGVGRFVQGEGPKWAGRFWCRVSQFINREIFEVEL